MKLYSEVDYLPPKDLQQLFHVLEQLKSDPSEKLTFCHRTSKRTNELAVFKADFLFRRYNFIVQLVKRYLRAKTLPLDK